MLTPEEQKKLYDELWSDPHAPAELTPEERARLNKRIAELRAREPRRVCTCSPRNLFWVGHEEGCPER